MDRRTLLQRGSVLAGGVGLGTFGSAHAAEESPLIYLAAVLSDGSLSRCQAEVWYVKQDGAYFVVTQHDAWRADAVRRGLTNTQIWEGDAGLWQSSDRYLKLPKFTAEGALTEDTALHASLLTRFGEKYSAEWGRWGPRFRKGLADGARVMLRYTPA